MDERKEQHNIMEEQLQRLPAELLFQKELVALAAAEKDPVPVGWKMSPRSVRTYICGGRVGNTVITPKYIGHEELPGLRKNRFGIPGIMPC